MSMKNFKILYLLILLSSNIFAQSSYLSISEIYGRKNKQKTIEKPITKADIKSRIRILINYDLLAKSKVGSIIVTFYLLRDNQYVNLNDNDIPISLIHYFPITDPLAATSEARTTTAISPNSPDSSISKEIMLDLKLFQKILKERDVLRIRIEELTSSNVQAFDIELIDAGLDAPKELAVPLMISSNGEKDSLEINYGFGGIWHFNTRGGLENYLGFGLVLTPNDINLSNIKNANLGIIPTISLGLGRKNPDIFLLGAGYSIGTKTPIYYISFNMSWISRKLTP